MLWKIFEVLHHCHLTIPTPALTHVIYSMLIHASTSSAPPSLTMGTQIAVRPGPQQYLSTQISPNEGYLFSLPGTMVAKVSEIVLSDKQGITWYLKKGGGGCSLEWSFLFKEIPHGITRDHTSTHTVLTLGHYWPLHFYFFSQLRKIAVLNDTSKT